MPDDSEPVGTVPFAAGWTAEIDVDAGVARRPIGGGFQLCLNALLATYG